MLSFISIRWRIILFHVLSMLVIGALLVLGLFVLFGISVAHTVEQQAEAHSNEAVRIVESTGGLTPEQLSLLNRDNVMIATVGATGQVVSQVGFGLPHGTQFPPGEWSRTLIRGEGLVDDVRGTLDLWDDREIYVHSEPIADPSS